MFIGDYNESHATERLQSWNTFFNRLEEDSRGCRPDEAKQQKISSIAEARRHLEKTRQGDPSPVASRLDHLICLKWAISAGSVYLLLAGISILFFDPDPSVLVGAGLMVFVATYASMRWL
jgi:hypothetical protein